MKRAKTIALVAGAAFILLALLVQGVVPYLLRPMTGEAYRSVTRTVRTSLGTLTEVPAQAAAPTDDLVKRGRAIYVREGCWYCHSQYTRPAAGEERRWGPVAEVGEYAHDLPHLFGTRRIGPDLHRVGGKYGDDWHAAHFFDPRQVVPDSIMPRFTWFFREQEGRQALSDEGKAVTAYLQGLGMQKGKWRDAFPSQAVRSGSATLETSGTVERGKRVYERRCAGCHGEKGDGKGPAPSSVLFAIAQPRDFTSGVYKFRLTPTGSVPLDGDLYRTITAGIRGTAMPPWFNLSEQDRWDVVHFIKTFNSDFRDYPPEAPIVVPRPPEPTAEFIEHGKQVFDEMKCWECHGREGRGDGPKSDGLEDDFGDRIPPADFTRGIFKSGPRPEDIFRTFMTGLSGTPMPSFADSFTSPDDGWALTYFVLSLSADREALP
jgi:cytochrome c oxidase cbb3-type subunit 2